MTDKSTAQAANTDKELWRKQADDYYSPSIHITSSGDIGINVGGLVFVAPVEKWHKAMKHCPEDKTMWMLVEALQENIKMIEDITIRFYAPTKAESTDLILKSTIALAEYEKVKNE